MILGARSDNVMKKQKINISGIINIVLIILFAFLTMFPFYLMLATSTKSQFEFATNFWGVAFPVEWQNYAVAWKAMYKYVINTLKITILYVIGNGIISVMAGYAFAKMKFKGKEFLYMLLLSFQMIPNALILIPQFLNAYQLGLYNSHAGVVIPLLGSGAIVSTMLARSFFEGIPDEIFESVRTDGGNEFVIVTRFLIPLSKPIIGTNALFAFFGMFNNYMWPFLMLKDDGLKVISIGLKSLSGQYGVDYGVQMAAYSIMCIPLMILIAATMKVYINGISAGAVKG